MTETQSPGTPGHCTPFPLQVQGGRRYLLCACGRSRKKPLCDGAHAGSGKLPAFYTATESGVIQVCCGGASGSPPLCDLKCQPV